MMLRTDKHCFNDGVVQVYRESDRKTDFNAKRNVHSFDDMAFIVKLDFSEQSRRQQDMEFAEQMGFSLSLKIKTRHHAGVDNKCKCVIGNTLYDISYLDKTRTEMYLYLQEVRRLGQHNAGTAGTSGTGNIGDNGTGNNGGSEAGHAEHDTGSAVGN